MDEIFIRGVRVDDTDDSSYPFSIPAIKAIESITFTAPVTFFVGENGTGKSTIIESIAIAAGFNAEGGTKNYNFSSFDTTSSLSEHITLIRGSNRESTGYFLRAETFYTTANYAETGTWVGADGPTPILFDGKHIHKQSHGEAFMSIINNFDRGLYIFDEPESALSPQRQLELLVAINELAKIGSQFIIATHSPILLAYTGATIYELSDHGIEHTTYDEIEHVKLTKDFLNNPTQYLNRLLG